MSGGVKDGQLANENTFNEAFMKENGDTETIGKVGLNNSDLDSGASIVNTQKAINKAFDTSGIADEDDANAKVYANINYISDGDNRKQAIEKLDEQLKLTTDSQDDTELELDTHIADFLAHREVDTFANLTTWALTAPNGAFAFATDTKQSFQVIDTALEPIGGGSALRFRGTFDADTNTPDIVNDPILADGDFWIVTVAGTTDVGGITDWEIDDWALFSEGAWYKIDQSNKVTSVNGKTGTVVLNADDVAETDTRYWSLKNNYTAAIEPTVNDDDSLFYSIGSRWIVPTDETEFVCLEATAGAAVWEQISGGGAGGLSIWDSVKAEKIKLKDWTNIGASVIEAQEVEVASGKASYKIPMLENEGAFRTILVPQGAIDANTNGLTFIYKSQLGSDTEKPLETIRVRVLNSSDDSELLSYELDPANEWTYSKQTFNFGDFTAPSIKLEFTSTDINAGDFFLDQIELNSNPNTLGNSVQTESVARNTLEDTTGLVDTGVVNFDGFITDDTGSLINITTTADNGTIFEVVKDCIIEGSVSWSGVVNGHAIYFTINSTVLTAVLPDNVICEDTTFTQSPFGTLPISYKAKAGQKLRLQTNAALPQIKNFSLNASANTKQVFFESESEDLDEIWFNVDASGSITRSKYIGNNGVNVTKNSTGNFTVNHASLLNTVNISPDAQAILSDLSERQVGTRIVNQTLTSFDIIFTNTITAAFEDYPFSVTIKKNAPDLRGITTLAVPANVVGQDRIYRIPSFLTTVQDVVTFSGLSKNASWEVDLSMVTVVTVGSAITIDVKDGSGLREQLYAFSQENVQGTGRLGKVNIDNPVGGFITVSISSAPSNGGLRQDGNNVSNSSYIQLSRRNEGNSIGTMPKNNFTLDGVEREVVGESVGGLQVYYVGIEFDVVSDGASVGVIDTNLNIVSIEPAIKAAVGDVVTSYSRGGSEASVLYQAPTGLVKYIGNITLGTGSKVIIKYTKP